ncbi:hypothetical protein A1O1_03223 [Capronia coronata CBS 617.96]|uniref:Fe2OG dioxygenase domain-containing protein n=1 Tax=Capronia coronata CBS 617.96 TaxID=1182541 RepID=W9YYQ4_9EURO|nr:uncharacterized protein A1O1_03223 [Capronia coronata CBS 617.96]EXJ94825.1 hypothetical protein A1O1_03223 [Capronia coronata CBS 617.96]
MLFPAGSLPPGPPIETKKALLLLDFQNDFVSPEGKLPVANVVSFLPNLIPLVAEFRAKGEVIWVGTEYKQPRSTISATTGAHSILLRHSLRQQDPDDGTSKYLNAPSDVRSPTEDPLSPSQQYDVTHDREAFLAPLLIATKYRCCIPGTPGADYPDIIKNVIDPQQDLVILKSHYSAFTESPLLVHLRTRLITELYVCGSLSNIAVYATVLDAVCHGLQVTIVEDCLGFNDEKCHVEAMRQMADHMGANGIDCQELRDDLAGLLGDVVHEEEYTTRFQVSLPPPARRTKSHTSRKQIHNWIAGLDGQANEALVPEDSAMLSIQSAERTNHGDESVSKSESSPRVVQPLPSERSSPRKRSTSDVDSLEEPVIPRISHKTSVRRASNTASTATQMKRKQSSSATRKKRPSNESQRRSPPSFTPIAMVQDPPARTQEPEEAVLPENDLGQDEKVTLDTTPDDRQPGSRKKDKLALTFLGPEDTIGQGDSRLFFDLLNSEEADRAFQSCKESIKWQKMFHRSGEVPRLVAVQGEVAEDGSCFPIYRHPADESPELLPFDSTVNMLRLAAERVVGHRLNHVLIQWYRNGEDNISEHSDKTLDVVHRSNIVNLSLGAQRTMTLRKKRSAVSPVTQHGGSEITRPSQRIHLPHNSLFVLGQETNRHWLHAIRADKRPTSQKDPAELAYEGERISLTFRHIGTFIDPTDNTIWGQGATSKQREGARRLLTGRKAEEQGEAMVRAFGQENHRSTEWDWDEWYGNGFDVVNFETKKA